MKSKYLIGAIAALVLVVATMMTLQSKKLEYSDLSTATRTADRVQIAGTWVKEKGSSYNSTTDEFRFTIRDEKGSEMPVVLGRGGGGKPNNFELAVSLVVTGQVEGGTLKASNIMTKCPSKYESKGEELTSKGGGS